VLLSILQVLWSFIPAYAADVAPVLAKGILESWAKPLDLGYTFRGRPIFGSHKTWRGLVVGGAAACAAYQIQVLLDGSTWLRDIALLDYVHQPFWPGFFMGIGAIGGDAIKSFFKRQIGIGPGSPWLVFDQLDFFFGASLLLSLVQPLPLAPWLAALPIVFVCDVAITALAYSLGMKEAWI